MTAGDDGHPQVDDEALLARATSLGRVLFSMDVDLLAITAEWLALGRTFGGLIYARQFGISVGQAVVQVEWIAKDWAIEDVKDQVIRLPL